jgi:acyl carrier protein
VTRQQIHDIWSRHLRLDDFSDDDDFFALGGPSLIMIRIQESISADLGVEVPMDQLFRLATVTAVAEHVDGQLALS